MIAESAAKIARAGGHVCIGSHGEMQGIGYHWEMWCFHSGGWQPLEVLRAATLHGAEAIGYAQDLGSIEPGKLADLVVLSADPLKDIQNTSKIRYVMKNGELYEGDTLDRVWPEKKGFRGFGGGRRRGGSEGARFDELEPGGPPGRVGDGFRRQ